LWRHVQRYDLLDNHYLFSFPQTAASMIARWQGVPYTVRAMGQLTAWSLQQSRLKKQLYSVLIERRSLNGAAAIHCTSAQEAADVARFGVSAPTLTLPLGVRPPQPIPQAPQQLRQRYGIAAEVPIVLFLSRLHYKKQPDVLIEALGALRDCGHPAHLLLVGSGEPDYVATLQQQVAALGLADEVTFAGFVSGWDKDLVLQGADLFALPSQSENFGIAIAEAMAAALPVVVTPGVQIATEIAAAEAGEVVAGTASALTEAIAGVLADREHRRKLGQNGRALVERRYSWDAIAGQLAQAYADIVNRTP
jgi:glycosyltransferase involved in cell wall biosynthesis